MVQDAETGDWSGTVIGGSVMKQNYNEKEHERSVCQARIRIMPQLVKGNLIKLMREF